MCLRCAFVFFLSFLVSFSGDAFGMRKSPVLQGSTDFERRVVETLGKGQQVSDEDINGLMNERKKAFLEYVDDVVLASDSDGLYTFCVGEVTINLKNELIEAIKAVQVGIDTRSLLILNSQKGKDYEKSLVKRISRQGNDLVAALFKADSYLILMNRILSSENLYGELADLSFAFIRRMSDLEKYDDRYLGLPKSIIDSNFARIFPCSRRLMRAVCFDELVRKNFYFGLTRSDFLKKCHLSETGSVLQIDVDSTSEQEARRVVFSPKNPGINPGYVLRINGDNFFIKMFHLASYKKRKGSKEQASEYGTRTYISDSLSFQASLRSSKNIGQASVDFKLNLAEPFIYIILNLLGIGPEFTLVINPYVYQGMYIVTKDVSLNDKLFTTFKNIEDMIRDESFSVENLKRHDIVLSINELDFLSKLLGLRDLHYENFGFLFDRGSIVENSLKVVDFVYPSCEFESQDPVNNFIERKAAGLNIAEDTLIGLILRVGEAKKMESIVFAKLQDRVGEAYSKLPKRVDDASVKGFANGHENISSNDKFKAVLSFALDRVRGYLMKERGNLPEENMLSFAGHPRTNAELVGFSMDKENERSYFDAIVRLKSYADILSRNYERFQSHIGSM